MSYGLYKIPFLPDKAAADTKQLPAAFFVHLRCKGGFITLAVSLIDDFYILSRMEHGILAYLTVEMGTVAIHGNDLIPCL